MKYSIDIPEVRVLMARKGYNITQLADKMGYSRESVSLFLRGNNPSYNFMCKLIEALDIEPEQANKIFFAIDLRTA